ncbi:hypothetical protein GCM10009733_008030 [Nonomuraea maheshkhaliensis]|uniref:Transposase n=1 Tax=Nonomuraea maheshkhaliensis TaxID=419590 RepID=A0ABN2EQ13_9ACTN
MTTEKNQHLRAGKGPGDVDWEHVAKTPLLRFHAALILGIVDPTLMPSPMSEAQGEWVRQNAWTKALRAIENVYPYGIHRWCRCQAGTCWNCLSKRCAICVHRQHSPKKDDAAGTVTDRRGFVIGVIVHLPHQKPCTWVCKCLCRQRGAIPSAPLPEAVSPPIASIPGTARRSARPRIDQIDGQADLFNGSL